MSNLIRLAPGYYPEFDSGRPVSNGKIYVGEPDTDPTIVANQKQVTALQESGVFIDIPQPIRTSAGGVPIYNGSAVSIFVDGRYSLRIDDANDSQVYYIPDNLSDETINLSLSDYGCSLSDALTNIGSNDVELKIDCDAIVSAATPITIPKNVILRFINGYTISLENGSTLEIYSPANILSSDYQKIIEPNSSSSFTFTIGGSIPVGWFGVTPSSTVSDNNTGINFIIASGNTDCVVEFLGAAYSFSAPWVTQANQNITFVGQGIEKTVLSLDYNTFGNNDFIASSVTTDKVSVFDLSITMVNSTNNVGKSAIKSQNNGVVNRVKISGWHSDAILIANSSFSNISNCEFDLNLNSDLKIDTSNGIVIEANKFSNSANAVISNDSNGLKIVNNDIDTTSSDALDLIGSIGTNLTNCTVRGNRITNVTGSAVKTTYGIGNIITNNMFNTISNNGIEEVNRIGQSTWKNNLFIGVTGDDTTEQAVTTITNGFTLQPNNSGYEQIDCTGSVTSDTTTAISNGAYHGQIMSYQTVTGGALISVLIKDNANTDFGSDITLGERDVLSVIWDKNTLEWKRFNETD
jgi:hypothetical protein